MAKRIKDKEVISKGIKGERKELIKEDNNKNIFTLVNKYKIYIVMFAILIILLILGMVGINRYKNNIKVLTINDYSYTKSDFMIYIYSAKYNYYGNNLSDVKEEDLNVMYDDEEGITIRDYLKNVALNDIKTSAAIKELASDNSITLTDEDYDELEKEKKKFINSLGGKKEYKKFLKENSTTDSAYDKMSETDKLYKRIIKKLYSEDKLNDLTKEEMDTANNDYGSHYIKLKQIILTTIDIKTGKSLNVTTINQKETLARNIVELARKDSDFDDLIKKYSEAYNEDEESYELYYKKGELLDELENEVLKLKPGEVSNVIKTKYAYHIIKRLELDDSKLNDYYDELRENKCISDIKDYIDDLKIIYHNAYEKIK